VTDKRGHAPVVFDEASFDADTKQGNAAGADVARAARRAYERDGVPSDDLRRCEAEGSDGTLLPHCLKVYMPPPAGRFGMVFQLEIVNGRGRLRYLAFGIRHHPRESTARTVYEIAHQRLHG
jgi:hypothetical protein